MVEQKEVVNKSPHRACSKNLTLIFEINKIGLKINKNQHVLPVFNKSQQTETQLKPNRNDHLRQFASGHKSGGGGLPHGNFLTLYNKVFYGF